MSSPTLLAAESFLPELLELAQADDAKELNKVVEEKFEDISTEDVSELQMKVQAGGDTGRHASRVGDAIQASLQSRLTEAKSILEDLITSSKGDINQRIKRKLKEQATPLPMLMVLQLNIAEAMEKGDSEKMQALMHMSTVMNEELEKKAPRTKALLNKLLRIEDKNIRENILRHHLTPQEVGSGAPDLDGEDTSAKVMAALVTPSRLAPAIDEVVKEVDRKIVAALGPDDESRYETLDRIREVAKHARIVIGDVYGEAEMDQFSADLTPAFTTLMTYKARERPVVDTPDEVKDPDAADTLISEKQD